VGGRKRRTGRINAQQGKKKKPGIEKKRDAKREGGMASQNHAMAGVTQSPVEQEKHAQKEGDPVGQTKGKKPAR